MKKILIFVDDTKSSKAVLSTFRNSAWKPERVILLHVQRLEGRSLMIDMLGEPELSTLKDSLEGTEYKEELDRKAERILSYYTRALQNDGTFSISTVIRAGHPAPEILQVAEEENVDLIILGSGRRRGLSRLLTGSFAGTVQKNAKVPVIVAKMPVMCEEPYSWKDAVEAITVTGLIVLGMFFLGAIL
jgi:nucleotide-binding universal stress UspA family protein